MRTSTARSVAVTAVVLLVAACSTAQPAASQAIPSASTAVATTAPTEAATPTPKPEPTKIRFTFDWVCQGDWAPLIVAESKGYFDEANLEVEYVRGNGSSDALTLIAAGGQDMGQIAAPALVLGKAQDLPVTVVGVLYGKSQVAFLASVDAGIHEIADIEGKKPGVQVGEFEGALWQAWTKKHGLDRSTMTEVPITGFGQADMFIAEDIDLMVIYFPGDPDDTRVREAHPGDEVTFPIADDFDMIGTSLAVTNSFLADHPDAVRAFVQAIAMGAKDVVADPQAAAEAVKAACPEVDLDGTRGVIEIISTYWASDQAKANGFLTFTPEQWETTKNVLVDGGLLDSGVDVTSLYTQDYLPDPPILP